MVPAHSACDSEQVFVKDLAEFLDTTHARVRSIAKRHGPIWRRKCTWHCTLIETISVRQAMAVIAYHRAEEGLFLAKGKDLVAIRHKCRQDARRYYERQKAEHPNT